MTPSPCAPIAHPTTENNLKILRRQRQQLMVERDDTLALIDDLDSGRKGDSTEAWHALELIEGQLMATEHAIDMELSTFEALEPLDFQPEPEPTPEEIRRHLINRLQTGRPVPYSDLRRYNINERDYPPLPMADHTPAVQPPRWPVVAQTSQVRDFEYYKAGLSL